VKGFVKGKEGVDLQGNDIKGCSSETYREKLLAYGTKAEQS
jgi:hypothetical protein